LFELLDQEFRFTLDAAASKRVAKCPQYFDRKRNALTKPWTGGPAFCNPPYGKETHKWVRKAFLESQRGTLVVMLLPAWTDRNWFHEFCIPHGEIRFIRGRVGFVKRSVLRKAIPWGVVIVIFRPGQNGAGRLGEPYIVP